MAQEESSPMERGVPDRIPPQMEWGWLRVLLGGLALFIVTTLVLFLTGNPNLYPTVILVGNFLIPAAFVTFVYDHQHLSLLSPQTIAQSFIVGGILGVLGASLLEPLLVVVPTSPVRELSLSGALTIGVIEEGCKILAVAFLARHMRHNVEMDGLLLGAAVGMGFAALESTGYAFTAFLLSQGHVGDSIAATVLRGLLAPFGHGIWTGIAGAVLFRESGSDRFRLTRAVALAFVFVTLLHGFWDGLPRTIFLIVPPGFEISLVTLILSILGVAAFVFLFRQALRRRANETPAVGA